MNVTLNKNKLYPGLQISIVAFNEDICTTSVIDDATGEKGFDLSKFFEGFES